ncbi:hypothetical protein CHS0354_009941 [Potamilus streckersoni]|uniref:G-protein coupled receptors family 1 profile domain-containing protein n=1 Tax=Potamilus streckersoni TaxID=2493646 RepID=A0AAE0TD44_9BIVA|nr:hypothetical protein CHS0354_009941 [Potamilus streckersoni]
MSNFTDSNMSTTIPSGSLFTTDLQMTTQGRVKILGPVIFSVEHLIGTSVVLGIMILCTIVGNVFVIAAIILEKNLQNVANYLVLSLAVADLMVATMVMPLSVVSVISRVWFLNAEMCDMWISFDVLCCTASILHLLAISIDRYWAVTHIDYVRNRTAKRILIMIALVWIIALCISIPPLFGWKNTDNNPEITGECIISQDHGYTIFSTVGAFYLPTLLMMIIYGKIFMVARERIRRKRFAQMNKIKMSQAATMNTETTALTVRNHKESPSRMDVSEGPCNGGSSGEHDDNENSKLRTNGHVDESTVHMLPRQLRNAKKAKEKLEMKRERKAARTLAIITGAFIS